MYIDVMVINTCCFIDDAKQESIQTILDMARYKEEGRLKALVVTGCLAQRYKQEIIDEIPEVDVVLGATSYDKIVEAVEEALEEIRSRTCRRPCVAFNACTGGSSRLQKAVENTGTVPDARSRETTSVPMETMNKHKDAEKK